MKEKRHMLKRFESINLSKKIESGVAGAPLPRNRLLRSILKDNNENGSMKISDKAVEIGLCEKR